MNHSNPDCNDEEMARIVKGRVESTTLGEIATYMKEVYRRGDVYLAIRLDLEEIRQLDLDIEIFKVAEKILRHSFSKLKVTVDDIVLLRPDRLRVRPFVKENNATRRAADITARHRNKEARKKEMEGRPHFVMLFNGHGANSNFSPSYYCIRIRVMFLFWAIAQNSIRVSH